MSTLPVFEDVEALAKQLSARDRLRLIARLAPQLDEELTPSTSREQLGTEGQALQPQTENEEEPDIFAIAGHLLVPQAEVIARADARIRERMNLRADEPIPYDQIPTIEQVQASLQSIPYDDKLSDLIIAMREE